MGEIDVFNMSDKYDDYLSDESKIQGIAQSISFPRCEDDIKEVLKICQVKNMSITIQGNLTGISGGAVPQGGHILNLSEMNKVIGMTYDEKKNSFYIKAEPGVLLKDLNHDIITKNFDGNGWSKESQEVLQQFKKASQKMFPPDPTETLASIGGMVACNASGACSYYYGSTRNYIEAIKVITTNGELYLRRGIQKLEDVYELINCEKQELPVITKNMQGIKNVAGYYCKEDMDLIDLFIGAEGSLGIITEIELRLIDKPKNKSAVLFFFNKVENALEFVKWLRKEKKYEEIEAVINNPVAIEYFNKDAFDIVNDYRNLKPELKKLPIINEDIEAGIYIEFHENNEEKLDDILEQLVEVTCVFEAEEGSEWFAFDDVEYNKLKTFRHAIPECVNILIDKKRNNDKKLKKIGTDMAVANIYLTEIMKMYESDLENSGLESLMFGHIGDNHIHVNIIPNNMEEYNKGVALVSKWAEKVIAYGGTIAAEHGVGRMKKELFKKMFSEEDMMNMKKIKQIFDSKNILNKGINF
ncbi:FAD-binding oxidoreductase [Oceanirhabdus seepicola]|uniref:D-lactate dehydrogenase (cytochrome) n=1 Tax=Oceanirhabdus seepicola TaxID=2828781 RepID=A0A9J6NWE4_9CLOT|nr:FAD-binding oxidoreductase [Oceanirhabdus seepicola]MCM1988326.1 FAD-binding oxidoreductase [Oceanirhabdus seepicola]